MILYKLNHYCFLCTRPKHRGLHIHSDKELQHHPGCCSIEQPHHATSELELYGHSTDYLASQIRQGRSHYLDPYSNCLRVEVASLSYSTILNCSVASTKILKLFYVKLLKSCKANLDFQWSSQTCPWLDYLRKIF